MQTSMGTGQQSQKVDASLEESVRRFNDHFNRFDRKAVAGCFAEDGTLFTPRGEAARGRAEIERAYGHDVDDFLDGSTSRFTIVWTRRIGEDCALLDLDHEIRNCKRADGTRGDLKLHNVMLAQRSGSGWLWLDARPYAFMTPPETVH